jgi:hypothetical protein
MPSTSTLFTISEPVWLLALWTIEVQDKRPAVSDGWRPRQRSGKIWHSE